MYALTNNFRSWIDVSSEELKFLCLKEAKRNFHSRLFSIVEPLFQKVPLTLLLPTPKVTPPSQPEHITLVVSETNLEAGSAFGVKRVVIYEEIFLKTLEVVKAENSMVKERLNKQDEMFKVKYEKRTRIEGML